MKKFQVFKMAHTTLLTSVLSFFLITISADVQDIIVNKLHIDINISPDNYLFVTCYFLFDNLRTTTEISMYYIKESSQIRTVSLIKKATDTKIDFISNDYNSTTNILTFYFNKMRPGLYLMNVTFLRTIEPAFDQVYFDLKHEQEIMWLSSTHFQPIWIQRIIPCWVRSKEDGSFTDMLTFNLSISHPARYSVLTNVPKQKERLDEKAWLNRKRTYFGTTPRMSPYQLLFVVTNFAHTIIDEDDDVSMWCRKRSANFLQFALTIARDITSYLQDSKEWPRCRCSKRVKLIVIPKIQNSLQGSFPELNDSLVHPGIIIVNEHDITYNKKNDTVGRKHNVIRLLGSKVTQEYYEWIVNPYWEPSTWLSKGFATFIATHNLNQIWPNLRMIDLFVVQVHHECLDFDVDNEMLPFFNQNNNTVPDELIDNMKASVFLRMMQHVYKAELFWNAINTFIYESIIPKKKDHLKIFWRVLEDALDETAYSLYNTNDIMHSWENKKGYLVLTVKRDYNTTYTSTMELIPLVKDFNFWKETRSIPLSYTTRTYMDFTRTLPRSWIIPPYTSPPYKLDLNYTEHSWVIFNIQQTGYYRVNYDDDNWARISTYLNNEDYTKFHVLNRAQLIDDAFQFMILDRLKADIFWQLTKYLERDIDYIAWYPMFKAIEYMSTSFQLYEDLYLIKQKIIGLLNKLLWNINYEEHLTNNDFTKALRQEAVQWACSLELPRCITKAYVQLRLHLDAHIKFFLPCWKKWTYCYGLTEASNIIWNQTLNKMEGNYNDKVLYLVTCPNRLVNIKNYISSYINNVESHITPSTMIQLQLRDFVNTIVESLKRDKVYNFKNDTVTYKDNTNFTNLLDNFEDIKPRQLKLSTAILILFNNIYFYQHLFDVWDIFVFKGNPNRHIWDKLEARRNQLKKHKLLFARIKPRN